MFKFRVDGKTRTLIGLGLTSGNIKRLRANEPVLVKLDALGIAPNHGKPVDIVIMVGDTEAEIMHLVETDLGLSIGPETVVNIDPRNTQ